MTLSHEDIGPKISSKIKSSILSRAKLLCSLCHEICTLYLLSCLFMIISQSLVKMTGAILTFVKLINLLTSTSVTVKGGFDVKFASSLIRRLSTYSRASSLAVNCGFLFETYINQIYKCQNWACHFYQKL